MRTFWPKYSSSSAIASGSCVGDQLLDLGVDVGQAPLASQFGRRLDHAAVERHEPPVAARDHAVAGAGQPWIDAEDDHVP